MAYQKNQSVIKKFKKRISNIILKIIEWFLNLLTNNEKKKTSYKIIFTDIAK